MTDNMAMLIRFLFNKAEIMARVVKFEEAISVYDDIVKRFGDATQAVINEHFAGALVNKRFTLGSSASLNDRCKLILKGEAKLRDV